MNYPDGCSDEKSEFEQEQERSFTPVDTPAEIERV